MARPEAVLCSLACGYAFNGPGQLGRGVHRWSFSVRLLLMSLRLSLLLVWFVSAVNAQTIVSIHTTETLLKLQEGREAPRLLSLESGSSRIWSNTISEQLIDSVEQDGRTLPLHWKLDGLKSHADARLAIFVYESSSPR